MLIMLMCAACSAGAQVSPLASPPTARGATSAQVTRIFAIRSSATDAPAPTAAETQPPLPALPATVASLSATALFIPTSTPPPMDETLLTRIPAGLVLRDGQGLWLVRPGGRRERVLEATDARLSPDGLQAVYAAPPDAAGKNDIWLADFTTGGRRNLTKTPEQDEAAPQWWPGRAGIIAFADFPMNSQIPLGLLTVSVTGGDVTVVDSEAYGLFAFTPDGKAAIYTRQDGAQIYRVGEGVSKLDPRAYGLPYEHYRGIAVTQDGRYLAFEAGPAQIGDVAVVALDLQERTAVTLHTYRVGAGAETAFDAAWSPDGARLAIVTWNEVVDGSVSKGGVGLNRPALGGPFPALWVISRDGREKKRLGFGHMPVWSPDGRWLAFSASQPVVCEVATWQCHSYSTEPGMAVQWLSL